MLFYRWMDCFPLARGISESSACWVYNSCPPVWMSTSTNVHQHECPPVCRTLSQKVSESLSLFLSLLRLHYTLHVDLYNTAESQPAMFVFSAMKMCYCIRSGSETNSFLTGALREQPQLRLVDSRQQRFATNTS
jgi:hypothetical protein